ncbi:MAG: ATP-binding cassette domain-containing protein [Planctomycetota bacterium]
MADTIATQWSAGPHAATELARPLGEACYRLGLQLSPARARLNEAVELAGPRRPVLLVIQRGEQPELIAVHCGDGPTVRIATLGRDACQTQDVSRAQVAERLGLAPEQIVGVYRLGPMGGRQETRSVSYDGRPLPRLWQFLQPDRSEIFIVVGFAMGLGVLSLATPIAVQALVNFIAFGGLIQPLIVLGLLLLFFLSLAGAIRVFKFYIVEVLQRRVFVRIVSDLSSRLPRVRLDVYDRGYGPELVNRFFDVLTIQKAGSALLVDGLDIILQASIGLLVLGFYHPFLLVFDIVLIGAITFILLGLGRGAIATARRESNAKYAVAGALEELARAPVTYKLVGAPELARARLAELAGRYIDARRSHYGVVLRQLLGAVGLQTVAGTALLTLGGFLVISGQLTLGQLVAAELIVSVALVSFVKFGKQLEAFYDLLAGVDKLGILFDLPLEDDPGESHVPGPHGASIALRGVAYRYPDRSTGVANVNLDVQPGERVAIFGGRGAGKSTIAELMSGLRDPDTGLVLFDDVDLRDIAKISIRTQMDLVKGFEIVQGTILENARLGRSDVTNAEVRDSLARLGILDELQALPDGLNTEISSAGAPLSRATAQLLMVARASVGGPRAIVIDAVLDELDAVSRERALAALNDPAAPWTLVVFTAHPAVRDAMSRVIELAPTAPLAAAAAGPETGEAS